MNNSGARDMRLTRDAGRRLMISAGLLALGIAVITALAWQSVTDMVAAWLRISAYNHGLFIVPIAAYLAWERRHRLAGLALEPFWPGLLVVGGFGLAWLAAHGAVIREGEQLAYVGMAQGLILTIFGIKIFRAQILPILYLYLMVPTGGFLLDDLQVIASWLTAQLLQLTSIPFYVEEFYFQLPVGSFFVAPGCAGLNFLLASLALSIVYADLLYAGWRRKLACILIWLAAAILANGVRIFAILWLAEITDRKLDIVDDHILYGWGFFLFVLMGLMWVGRLFSNIAPMPADNGPLSWLPRHIAPMGSIFAAAVASAALAAAILGYGLFVFAKGTPVKGYSLAVPALSGDWRFAGALDFGELAFPNADIKQAWRFEKGLVPVDLFAAYYSGQWDGHEAASDYSNIFGRMNIKAASRGKETVEINGTRYQLDEQRIITDRNSMLLWRWYCVAGHFTASALEVRARTAALRIGQRENPVTVFTMFTADGDTARHDMASLLRAISASGPGPRVVDAQGKAGKAASCW